MNVFVLGPRKIDLRQHCDDTGDAEDDSEDREVMKPAILSSSQYAMLNDSGSGRFRAVVVSAEIIPACQFPRSEGLPLRKSRVTGTGSGCCCAVVFGDVDFWKEAAKTSGKNK